MKIEAKKIKEWAQRLGFDACGMAPARPVDAIHIHWLDEWLKAGCEAGMSYMANHAGRGCPDGYFRCLELLPTPMP